MCVGDELPPALLGNHNKDDSISALPLVDEFIKNAHGFAGRYLPF